MHGTLDRERSLSGSLSLVVAHHLTRSQVPFTILKRSTFWKESNTQNYKHLKELDTCKFPLLLNIYYNTTLTNGSYSLGGTIITLPDTGRICWRSFWKILKVVMYLRLIRPILHLDCNLYCLLEVTGEERVSREREEGSFRLLRMIRILKGI